MKLRFNRQTLNLALCSLALLGTVGCSAAKYKTSTVFPGVARMHRAFPRPGIPRTPEQQLIKEAWLTLRVKVLKEAADRIRQRVRALKGRVLTERLTLMNLPRSRGHMKLRLPPAALDAFLSWIPAVGNLLLKKIRSRDVSKRLYDMAIALKNLKLTLTRLRTLLKRPTIQVGEVLKIEKEMTRVRGSIEKIKGEERWLKNQVAFATVHIFLLSRYSIRQAPQAKFRIGLRMSHLFLFQNNESIPRPLGGGLSLHFGPSFTLDMDLFPHQQSGKNVFMLTAGGIIFSEFLGGGRRRWFNPFVGLRMGYGYLAGRNTFLLAGEVGVEIFKSKYLLFGLNARLVTFLGQGGVDGALLSSAFIRFSF